MRPLLLVGRVRESVRAAVLADAARLAELPPAVARLVLPALAIAIPTVVSVIQATTPTSFQGDPYDTFTLFIYDVYTESIPLMAAAVLIGMLAPAAGALFVLAYAVGNVAATALTGELEPPVYALLGRLISFVVLWVLAVEVPLAARNVAEWWSYRQTATRAKRIAAVVAGGLVAALLTHAWAMAAALLITPVFFFTAPWGNPFVRAVQSISLYPHYLSLTVAVAGTLLLGVRYLGPRVIVGRWLEDAARFPTRQGRLVGAAAGMFLAIVLLTGLIATPLDAVIVVAAVVGSPILARSVLRSAGLAPRLAVIARPVRIVVGFGVAILVAWVVVGLVTPISTVDSQPISRWFPGVVGLLASYFVVQLFVTADEVAAGTAPALPPTGHGLPPVPTPLLVLSVPAAALLTWLALPDLALADDWDGYLDIPASLLKDAIAGASSLAASIAGLFGSPPPPPQGPPKLPEYGGPPGQDQGPKPRGQRGDTPSDYAGPEGQDVPKGPPPLPQYAPPDAPPPPPPPWYMPDGVSDFFS
jgi:hypothetical protein